MNGYTVKEEGLKDGDMIEIIEGSLASESIENWVKEIKHWKATGQLKDAKYL